MADTTVKILRIGESTQLNANGRTEPMMAVTYQVGPHGPFTEYFQKAGFDPNAVNARLKDHAMKFSLLQGL